MKNYHTPEINILNLFDDVTTDILIASSDTNVPSGSWSDLLLQLLP